MSNTKGASAYQMIQVARDARLEGRDEDAARMFDEMTDVAHVRRTMRFCSGRLRRGEVRVITGASNAMPLNGPFLYEPDFRLDAPMHYSADLLNETGRRLAEGLKAAQARGLLGR